MAKGKAAAKAPREPKTLVVATTKGGAGKTTSVVSLGDYWRRQGLRVATVDMDPNRKLTGWLAKEDGGERFVGMSVSQATDVTMESVVEALKAENDIVILDLAGLLSREMLRSFGLADAVLIPSGSSYGDIEEVNRTAADVTSVETAIRERVPDYRLPHAALLSRVNKQTTTFAAAKAQLEVFGIPVLENVLVQRVAYETAWWHQESPLDIGGKAVKDDVAAVATEILERLGIG